MLRRLRARYQRRFLPWLGELAVKASTKRAEKTLAASGPISVLVDVTVLRHAVTHETAWVSAARDALGPMDGPGYAARVPVHAPRSDSEDYRNIKFLAGVAHLAKLGHVKLYTSGELRDETFRQPVGRYKGYGYFDLSLFAEVKLESIDGIAFPTMGPKWMRLPSAEEQQRARLAASTDPLFRGLVERLGPKNDQDAWHIRTAEAHGMFCFLTMDYKLIRNVRSQAGGEPIKSLKTRIMTPRAFGEHFGLAQIPPHWLSYRDADCFVRPDLHMPGSRRRLHKHYRSK